MHVPILFGWIVVMVAGLFVLWLLWVQSGYREWIHHGGRRAHQQPQSEARMLQELHHTATRMEERVEALETILMERSASLEASHYSE